MGWCVPKAISTSSAGHLRQLPVQRLKQSPTGAVRPVRHNQQNPLAPVLFCRTSLSDYFANLLRSKALAGRRNL